MKALRLSFVLLLLCHGAIAQDVHFNGCWALRLGQKTFLVLTIHEDGPQITGTLAMPEQFEVGPDGSKFTKIAVPVQSRDLERIVLSGNQLHFFTHDAADSSTSWNMILTGSKTASLKLVEAPFEAWPLILVPAAKVSIDWDRSKTYLIGDSSISSSEMERIYNEDQKARDPGGWTPQRWTNLAITDRQRLDRTKALIAKGMLHSPEDFVRAAYVFQHGHTKQDYLLAHTLALAALARGDQGAAWIAAASLDAYLQAVGQKQVFGTRFLMLNGKAVLKSPYDSALIPQWLRRELGVPSVEVDAKEFFNNNH